MGSYVDNLLFTEQLSYLKELNADIDVSLVKLCSNEIRQAHSFYLVIHPESKRLSLEETVWQYLK
jgi:hypothetical protein